MRVSVSFNAPQAIKQIRFYQRDKRKQMQDEVIFTSLEIVSDAKKKITIDEHIDTGRLRASIDILRVRNDRLGTEIGTDVNYAIKIEEIDSYLFFAFEQNRSAFGIRVINILNK